VLSSHIHFNGQCEEAFKFYEEVLGGKIDYMARYEGSPAADQVPAEWRGKILHAHLNLDGGTLMGADVPPGRYSKPQGFNLTISLKEINEGKDIFEKLAASGNVVMPFAPTFWSPGFGMCVDRFGIPWMVNCERPQ